MLMVEVTRLARPPSRLAVLRNCKLHFFIFLLCGGHSSLNPRLPIPNRTVKRVCADDSVPFAHAKVGYRHAIFKAKNPGLERVPGFFVGGCNRTLRNVCAAREMDARACVKITSLPEAKISVPR